MSIRNWKNVPEGFTVPEGRVKPFGTGHAILSCINEVDAPFAVINADDYYGSHAFQVIYDFLTTHEDDEKIPLYYGRLCAGKYIDRKRTCGKEESARRMKTVIW